MRTEQASARSAAAPQAIPQALIRVLLNQSHSGALLSDGSGQHIEINERLREMLGLSQEAPVDVSLNDFVTLDEIADRLPEATHLPETPTIVQQKDLRCKDGHLLPVEITIQIVPGGYLLGTVRVMTPAREDEETAQLLADVVSSSNDAILTLDPDGIITSWNTEARQIFGYRAEEVVGENAAMLALEDRQDELAGLFERIRKGEHVDRHETILKGKDGKHSGVLLTVSSLRTARGKMIGILTIARDTTMQKHAETHLRSVQVEQDKRDNLAAAHADLKQTADELVEQRHRYYDFFDAVPDGYVVTDSHGAIFDINRAGLKLLGIEKPFAERIPILVFIAPKDQESIRTILTRMQRGIFDEAKEVDVTIQPRDGRVPPFAACLTVSATKHNGTLSGLHWMIRDVGERRKAEEALRLSEQRFRQISELSSDFAYSMNVLPDNSITVAWFTEALEDVTGFPSSTICKPNGWYWLCHPHDKPIFEAHLAKLLTGQPDTCEYRIVTRTGSVRWLRDSAHPKRDDRERIAEILGGAQDITERKHAEEALRASEERFRMTFYSIGDGVITTDIHGTVVRMNHLAESLTGWGEANAHGKPIHEVFRVINEESAEPVEDPVARVLRQGNAITLTNHMLLISKDGSQHPIAATASPIRDSRGETTGVVLVFHDQTELKELQQKLLLSHKMDAVGRLAAGVAHDFNNILAIILGLATLMKKNLRSSDPLNGQIGTILNAAERSTNLTKQLLAFASKQVVAPVPVNLNDSLESMKQMLTRFAGEDISLHLLPDKNLWNIRIDPGQIDQILTNLTANARDAISDTGTITVETGNVVVSLEDCLGKKYMRPGECVLLSFTDTGKGMDETILPRIFEPFFTTKPREQAPGLGLPTVFGIVKQNNGWIDVQSEPGVGTTFRIFFPRFHGEVDVAAKQGEEISLRGTETVLLVEDEEQILDLFAQTLGDLGYSVLKAASPAEAITLFREHKAQIHLLVTDVIMPGMNGNELAQRLKEVKTDLKVIFNSGYPAHIVAQRGIIEQGMNFLQKPFTPPELARCVRKVLNT